jgi:putative CocE/NonD family hydrolase
MLFRILLLAFLLISIGVKSQKIPSAKIYKKHPFTDQASGTLKSYDKEINAMYKGLVMKTYYLTMRDSTRLAVDLYLPKGLKEGDKIPCIVHQTRYWRRPDVKFPFNIFTNGLIGRTADMIKVFLSNGYAIVNVDVRGSGASFGTHPHPWTVDEVADGGEILDWACKQPWSNGKAGSMGVSYGGTTAEFLATNKHPALKAVVLMFSLFDIYEDNAFPGGVHNSWFTKGWGEANTLMDANKLPANFERYKWLIKGVAPVKNQRKTLKAAVASHIDNKNVHEMAIEVDYRDEIPRVGARKSVDDFSPHNFVNRLDSSAVAVYSYSGWHDGAYQHAAIKRHINLSNPLNKMILGPWEHGGAFNTSPYTRSKTGFDHAGELLKFFDYHVKGIKNGLYNEPRVHFFTVGAEKWQGADNWPPKSSNKNFYFTNNTLSENLDTNSSFNIHKVDNSFGSGEFNRWTAVNGKILNPYTYFNWKESTKSLLHYSSEKLENAMEISGHPSVSIHCSMNTCDGALFVYLEEEDENGNVFHVTEGQLKATHRKLSEEAYYREVVQQRRHSYKDEEIVVPNQIFEMKFDLLPISWKFKKGSKIRLSITGADKDIFEIINPDGYEIKIFDGKNHPSVLHLPISKIGD